MENQPKMGKPEFRKVDGILLREALQRGWRDLWRAPLFALVFAGFYVAFGWVMTWVSLETGQTYWLVFAAFGFPLLGPFAAVAFYDVSRRLARGDGLDWLATVGVIFQQSKRQLPSICAIIIFIFLFWFFIGHMIFALFLGLAPMTNVSSSWEVFLTFDGLMMLSVGSIVGAAIALLLYMITVISLPLLLDREVDYVTAMIASFGYVQRYPVPMFGWALFVAVLTFLSMVPGFLGLLISLPLLGHATWHLYDLLRDDAEPAPSTNGS